MILMMMLTDVFDSILGHGAFGDVYAGSLISSKDGSQTTAVAIKVLHSRLAKQQIHANDSQCLQYCLNTV